MCTNHLQSHSKYVQRGYLCKWLLVLIWLMIMDFVKLLGGYKFTVSVGVVKPLGVVVLRI